MKIKGKKTIVMIISTLLIIAIAIGTFALFVSYRMSLLQSMSFEEMLSYTTENNEDAIITVGIIKDGEYTFNVYGKNASILPKDKFQYEIGSITKTITTSLLCKAIYEGKVELSDPINRYIKLPQQEYYPTFQRLATHTSGYKNYYFERQMATNRLRREKNDYYGINTEMLNKRIGKISLEDKDYDFVYSNFGISVVGSALAEVYGRDFTALMMDFIKSELKLESTIISKGTGELKGSWNWKPEDAYIPAGALVSTIDDMMKYMKLHIEEELPYLSLGHEARAEVSAMKKQHEKMGIRIDAAGLGWMIDAENNIIWHNGATSNFNSYMAFDKERQIGVVILSNLSPNYRIPATVMGVKLIKTLQNQDVD